MDKVEKKAFDLQTAMESISFCDLERAKIACTELLDGYFIKKTPDAIALAWGYDRYSTMANIVLDYIVQAQQKLDEARKEAAV